MSLDVSLYFEIDTGNKEYSSQVYDENITHNLGKMAEKAGIYEALWRPEEINCKQAKDISGILFEGLKRLKRNPKHYEKFNAENRWGRYEHLVSFVQNYYDACIEFPKAKIRISR